MKTISLFFTFATATLAATVTTGIAQGHEAVDFIDPFIGTRSMGHVFPGACVPQGIVQLSPDTEMVPHNIDGEYLPGAYRYCAGYQYDVPAIVGFSHTHLSGTGHSDLGDMLLMPTIGEVQLDRGTADHYFAQTGNVTREGLLGMYVHGDEPSRHVPYLCMRASQPWKTQHWVREIMGRMYRPAIDGPCGNDDCGQMSAWHIFSAVGPYPVCPGTDQYVPGTPCFPYLKVGIGDGKYLAIKAAKASSRNRHAHGVRLNSRPWTKACLTYAEIREGGMLEFDMRPTPDKRRRLTGDERPYSLSRETLINTIR